VRERISHREKIAIYKRPFFMTFNAALREEFDDVVVALSYSRDAHVINLLNEYPVDATGRNASNILAIGEAISKLLAPQQETITDEQNDVVDSTTLEDTTDSDYGTEN